MKERSHIYCGYDPIPTSTHRPPVYEFTANTNTPCGGYGHGRSNTIPESAIVEVDLPEWVSVERGALCRKGCFAERTGTGDLVLIVCANPVTAKHTYIGECNHRDLIIQALEGGLLMYYPTEGGHLACAPVIGEFVRWM